MHILQRCDWLTIDCPFNFWKKVEKQIFARACTIRALNAAWRGTSSVQLYTSFVSQLGSVHIHRCRFRNVSLFAAVLVCSCREPVRLPGCRVQSDSSGCVIFEGLDSWLFFRSFFSLLLICSILHPQSKLLKIIATCTPRLPGSVFIPLVPAKIFLRRCCPKGFWVFSCR